MTVQEEVTEETPMAMESGFNSSSKVKNFYVDSLFSSTHFTPGNEELLLPLQTPQNRKFIFNTALLNNQFLQSNYMLQNANMQALTAANADPNAANPYGADPSQPPMLAIPGFNPSNFHSVPMNRHLQVVDVQKEAPKRPRTSGTSARTLSSLAPPGVELYEATYSNIDVYELIANGAQLMRRRDDGWVNATHILKVAGVDKGRRTRVLDKEVSVSKYEKVQGGYGKYQGTWVPLEDAKNVAQQFGVFDICAPILNIPI